MQATALSFLCNPAFYIYRSISMKNYYTKFFKRGGWVSFVLQLRGHNRLKSNPGGTFDDFIHCQTQDHRVHKRLVMFFIAQNFSA